MKRGMVTWRAALLLLSLLCFMSLPDKRLGGPGNTKTLGFATELMLLIANDKTINKNLATSFTSTLSLVLFPAIQTSSLLLHAISKSMLYKL